jgi:hypothetical protein
MYGYVLCSSSLLVLEDFSTASDNNIATASIIHEEIRLKITCKLLPVFNSKTIFTLLFTKSLKIRRHAHTHTHAHAFGMHVEGSLLARGRIEFTWL